MSRETYYTIEEVSKILRVSIRTVYRWIKNNKLKSFQITMGGRYKIPKSEIDRFYDHNWTF